MFLSSTGGEGFTFVLESNKNSNVSRFTEDLEDRSLPFTTDALNNHFTVSFRPFYRTLNVRIKRSKFVEP